MHSTKKPKLASENPLSVHINLWLWCSWVFTQQTAEEERCNEAKQSLLLDTFPLQEKHVEFCWKLCHFVSTEWN